MRSDTKESNGFPTFVSLVSFVSNLILDTRICNPLYDFSAACMRAR
jgi:hypothetical protein